MRLSEVCFHLYVNFLKARAFCWSSAILERERLARESQTPQVSGFRFHDEPAVACCPRVRPQESSRADPVHAHMRSTSKNRWRKPQGLLHSRHGLQLVPLDHPPHFARGLSKFFEVASETLPSLLS